jgi:hypothetical protein
MLAKLRSRLTYANVVATLALFVALGGSSYAAVKIKNNSVGSAQVKNNSIKSRDVKNKTLRVKDFKSGQLPAGPRGSTGAPGSARAYGRVASDGAASLAKNARVVQGSGYYCILTTFGTPRNIIATLRPAFGTNDGHLTAEVGPPSSGCPAGTDAYVRTFDSNGGSVSHPFYFALN